MKTMLRTAIAALSFASIGPAIAGESGGQAGGYVYPQYQFPTQSAPSAATTQNGLGVHAYVTQSSRGTWLFAPNANQGANG